MKKSRVRKKNRKPKPMRRMRKRIQKKKIRKMIHQK